MDFSVSEEQEVLRRTVREFLVEKLEPISRSIDEEGRIPRQFAREAGEFGLWVPTVPEEFGGKGMKFLDASLIAEEFGRTDISMATPVLFLLGAAWGYILSKYGNREVASEVLPKVAAGEWFLGIASTEPTGGSDVASIRTSARRVGDQWEIEGEKTYISGALEAKEWGGGHLVLAKTDPKAGNKGISMFYVPASQDGVEVSKLNNMGRTGISTCIVRYNRVRVPSNYLVGEENRGFHQAMDGFNHARALVAAACLGMAGKVLEVGLEYIGNREAFGRKLRDHQAIAFEAADLSTELEMSRLITYEAAWALDMNHPKAPVFAAMAKLKGPETAVRIVKAVMMWLGGYSYTKDAGVERAMRGILSYVVGAEGAANIMRLIISRQLLY
jgi:acyl-CoA dehydrogenase